MRLPPLRKLAVPLLLGLGIVATLGREMVFAWALGTSAALEEFRLAFGLPNTLAQTLGPAFIGVALPLLAQAATRGPEAHRQMRQRLLRFNLLAVLGVALVGMVAAAPLANLLAPGYTPSQLESVASSLRILFAFFALAAASFHWRALLNQGEVFWPGAGASLAISMAFIIGLPLWQQGGPLPGNGLAWLAVCGGGAVLLLHVLAKPGRVAQAIMRREQGEPGSAEESAKLAEQAQQNFARPRLLLPMLAAALYQISAAVPRFLDRGFATDLPQGGVAALEYSYNVITAPGILFGTSFVMLAYPAFVRALAQNRPADALRRLKRPFLLLLGATFTISLLVHFAATPLVTLFYQRGAYDQAASAATVAVLAPQALGLMPMVASMALAQGLLGLGALRLLLLLSATRILLRATLLSWMLPEGGLEGLGRAYAITEVLGMLLAAILFIWSLRQRRPTPA